MNPDTLTQFHVIRHSDSTSTTRDTTHISIDLNAQVEADTSYTYDDPDATLQYSGSWSHVKDQSYTGGDYKHTESFSNVAGDSVMVPFTGTAVRWIGSKTNNHGMADVYIDDVKQATVDDSGSESQAVVFQKSGLADGPHTLKIVVTGSHGSGSTDNYVSIDAIDVPAPGTTTDPTYPVVPQQPGTSISVDGRDSHIVVANYRLGDAQLQYSTSEIMTHAEIADRDAALLYGRAGSDGETVLHYDAEPKVTVLDGTVDSVWDPDRGDLRLNYKHDGLARVRIDGASRPLLLLLATDEVAATFWQQQTASGPVLVRGPSLLRGASDGATSLDLVGDTAQEGDLEVFAKAGSVTWNGKPVSTGTTTSGSRRGSLSGPKKVTLPELTDWKHAAESPEAKADFDDTSWTVADKTTTNSVTKPVTLPVLFADDYGFHYGDVWYRGHFKGTGRETGVDFSAITGRAGAWSVWLNGTLLGSSTGGQKTFAFPANVVRSDADNVLSVMVENMGHNEDYNEDDWHKQARGLIGATVAGADAGAVTWRIQGARGGENPTDMVRGPMNNGGLYGERSGWSNTTFDDSAWEKVSAPRSDTTPGVSWYRTNVKLDLPRDQDTSVGLRIDDDATRHYRVLIFVNGWQMGRYVNDTGPQHSFPIPTGVLNPNGDNTIALAVWNTDATSGGLGTVKLESYGSQLTSTAPTTGPTPTAQPTATTAPTHGPGDGSGGTPGQSPGAKPGTGTGSGGKPGTIGGLPITGTQAAVLVGFALLLLGVGVVLVLAGRRRRRVALTVGGDEVR
jgi:beta-galactosidase GanA